MTAPRPENEVARLQTLREYDILDTAPEADFDDLTHLAAAICAAPIALISLVDEQRQWFKSKVGLSITESSRDVAFCAYAILQPDLFVVPDALADERFARNPLVTATPKIRFYAGAPLISPEGHALGTLCVIDQVPRTLTPHQEDALRMLRRHVVTQLELRRKTLELIHVQGERHRMEEALQQSEQHFRGIFEHLEDVFYRTDLQGTIQMISPSVARYGYGPEELIGQNVTLFYQDPAVRERTLPMLLEQGKVRDLELVLRAKDGTAVPASTNAHLLFDDQHRPIGLEGVLRDITERKRAEAALRAAHDELARRVEERTAELVRINEQLRAEVAQRQRAEEALAESVDRYRTVAELTSDYAYRFRVDRDGSLVNEWVTDSFLRVIGLPVEEMRARGDWKRFVHADDWPLVRSHVERILSSGDDVCEFRFTTAAGESRCVRNYARAVRDAAPGVAVRIYGAAQDITERKRAEDALRRSEEKFAKAFRNSPDAITITSFADGRLVEVNESVTLLTGYTQDELIGRTTVELDFWADPADRDLYVSRLQQHGRVLNLEAGFRMKSGEIRAALVSGEIIDLAGGKYILGVVRDITERKRAGDERERLQAALRRTEVMATMGSLVSGVAHEVRNPLFGISATLDAFETRFGGHAGYQQYLTVLHGEVDRLNDLMRELLEYGKPVLPTLAPQPIGELIAEAVAANASAAAAAGVQLVVRDSVRVPVALDRDRMRQVFQNLLANAIQHAPRDTMITIDAHAVRQGDGTWIEWAIADSGPGFAEDDLPRIFEPFFSRRPGGTGLGLSIVQRIVEQHGGTVSAANRAEGGAIVTVRLPAESPSAPMADG